ncbi:hypothetical protein ACFVBP_10325 [Nocardioides sp. NPDC057764]|uniref:hypothetical protein n=1 Tax=Nocardioides sp. NPDC057764 TaxID=3346243 RepID=UPI00366ACE95
MTKNSGREKAVVKNEQPPLLDVRSLVIFTTSTVAAAVIGVLTWLASRDLWTSALAAAAAFGVSLERLHKWTA